jgi:hypothetical protein
MVIQYYVEDKHKVQLFQRQPSFFIWQFAMHHVQQLKIDIWRHETGHTGTPETIG